MKKIYFLAVIFIISITAVFSQGVAINSSGLDPHASAMLDVASTNSGVLIPRMTQAQRDAIASPANGLVIYQTNNTPGFYYFDGSTWVRLSAQGESLTGSGTATRIAFWSGASTLSSNANLYWDNTNNRLGLGTATPSAQLHTTGSVRFAGAGTPAAGRVLTSDASGNATWQDGTAHSHATLTQGTGIATFSYNGSSAATVSLTNTGVTAGTYGNSGANIPNITVDAQGRLTLASNRTLTPGDIGAASSSHSHANLTFNNSGSGDASGTAYNGSTAYTISYNTIGAVGGSGTATRVAFWSGASTLSSNANLYWDNTNSRLGIGTATPSQALHVQGNARVTGAYYDSNNTAGTSAQVLSSTGTGTAWVKAHTVQSAAASVTAGNWYRIASNNGNRADATFTLRDQISGGGHSTLRFHAGINYGDAGGISFTVLSHSQYGTPTFTKVRIIRNSTYDGAFLEVYCARSGSVSYDIFDNYQVNGWTPENWTPGSIPSGWTAHEYEVNRLFAVGASDDILSLTRTGNFGIGVENPTVRLDVNGQTRIVNSTSPTLYIQNDANSFANHAIRVNSQGTDRAFIASNGGAYFAQNVGIGTASPNRRLEVYTSSGNYPARFGSPDGYVDIGPANNSWSHFSTDRPRFYFNRGITVDQGLIGSYSQDLQLQTSGTTRIWVLNSNGNVGINNAAPAEILDVTGNIRASGIAYWGNAGVRTETRNDAGLQGDAGARSGFFETSAPSPAANWPAGASSWWHLLDVRHSNNTNNYAMQFAGSFFDQRLFFRKTNNNPAQPWVEVLTTGNLNSLAWALTGNSGTNPASNFLGTTDNQPLVIRTNNAEWIRILTNGNVGINNTSPTHRLQVRNNTGGVSAIYGDNSDISSSGTSWNFGISNVSGIQGLSTASGNYSAGVYGYRYGVSTNGAGVVGAWSSFTWGALGCEEGSNRWGIFTPVDAAIRGYLLVGNPSTPSSVASNGVLPIFQWNNQLGFGGFLSSGTGCGSSNSEWSFVINGLNSYYIYDNQGSRSYRPLLSPWMWFPTGANDVRVELSFYSNLEQNYDGVILEYTTNGSTWVKLDSWVYGGYNTSIAGSNSTCNGTYSGTAWSNVGNRAPFSNALNLGGNWVRFRLVGMEDVSNNSGRFEFYGFSVWMMQAPSFGGSFSTGNIYAERNVYAGSNVLLGDLAEYFQVEGITRPGMIIAANISKSDTYMVSNTAYNEVCIGVYSENPTLTLNDPNSGIPVALAGRVPVLVTAINGKINVGDYITTSNIPGVGMKADRPCHVIGMALEPYDKNEEGKILCLIKPGWYNPNNSTLASGEFYIPDNHNEIVVYDERVKENSKIFLTMLDDPQGRFWISRKENGAFTVKLSDKVKGNVDFDYLIENAVHSAKISENDVYISKVKPADFETGGWKYDKEKDIYWKDETEDSNIRKISLPVDTYPQTPPMPENPSNAYVFYPDKNMMKTIYLDNTDPEAERLRELEIKEKEIKGKTIE